MPNARRVIFSSYVVPTQSVEAEETSIRHTEFQASPNGTLSGKGIASINAAQTFSDGWISFAHQGATWDDQYNWELLGETWNGKLEITTTATNQNLSDFGGADLKFLYIKNIGNTNNCLVSLNGVSGNYYIIIPPNGSVNLRGGSTSFDCNDVFVKSNTSTTTIEFVLAE